MPGARHGVKGAATRARAEDKRARDSAAKASKSLDSFVNFAQKLGVGADNALSSASYGFNPISRQRVLLEWIHRGSWLGGVAVDVVAEDMTRKGVDLGSELTPEQTEAMEETAVSLNVWGALSDTIKWARLYGGAIAVLLVEGQDTKTPLRLETIDKGQFKGLLVLDRWMVEPTLENLVTELGPSLGLPKFYRVMADSAALPRMTIHHSRVIRLEGIRLPYQQRLMENLWSISVLERLYDRMIAFDSATTGAAQLVYKSYLRTYNIDGMRDIVASGGQPLEGLVRYVEMMRRFQGIEGITLLDGKDKFEAHTHGTFAGLSDALTQFGQQLSGALQIPLVRLFGQSPAGFNTGETDLRNYYDGIEARQERELRVPVTTVYRAIAQSCGIRVPRGFRPSFRSLFQLTEEQKATVAETVARAVVASEEAGLISQQGAMKELKQSARVTGVFSNITDDDMRDAEETLPPAGENALGAQGGIALGEEGAAAGEGSPTQPAQSSSAEKPPVKESKDGRRRARDATSVERVARLKRVFGLNVVVEHEAGTTRRGPGWEVKLPADYGYVMRTMGADGDQVDCYLGDGDGFWLVDQKDAATGEFDEHKLLLGFRDLAEALGTYCAGFSDGRGMERCGGIRQLSLEELTRWLGAQAT